MSLQEAALQALEALEEQAKRIGPEFDDPFAYGLETDRWALMRKAIAALHEALPRPEQREPLAWFRLDEKTNEAFLVYFPSLDGKDWRPLYTAPTPRKPLPEAMNAQCPYAEANPSLRGAYYDGWMQAEAAHGITGEQT